MIGFVTWPPYLVQKGGQVTKPIIVVKMPCKLLYVIQVKGFLIKYSTSWPYLISEFLVAYSVSYQLSTHLLPQRLLRALLAPCT